jgi:4,5-DOPA dioxygenase extradiol
METRGASLFISHGAPTLPLEDSPARRFLETLGRELPRPKAIVALSPHWLTGRIEVKSPARFKTWHDFGGFPEELYRIRYEPAGESALAPRVLALLREGGFDAQPSADARLDHGVWVPLMLMYPQADIPVVQVSATWDTPARYRELAQALRSLAREYVLILGSGGLVHNLREIEFGSQTVPDWARRFDDWTDARLAENDWDALCDYRRRAPDAARAHPTEDHFLPLFFAGGAGGQARALHRSFSHGGLSMAAYGFS